MFRKERIEYFQECKQWPYILDNVGACWEKLIHDFVFSNSLILLFF